MVVLTVMRFDANQRTFFTMGNPGAEVIVSKAALSFKSCFDDAADGRVRSDGFVSNGRNKRPSLPKSLGQMTHFKGLNIFKWDGVPNKDIEFLDTAATFYHAYLQVFKQKTSSRANWETVKETFDDLSKFLSKTDGNCGLFSSLRGKVVLQGTMSNKRATKHLRDASFGFAKVIECDFFFVRTRKQKFF